MTRLCVTGSWNLSATATLRWMKRPPGKRAIDAMRSTQYACVILDIGLPDMDGRELLKRLQEENVGLPPHHYSHGKGPHT